MIRAASTATVVSLACLLGGCTSGQSEDPQPSTSTATATPNPTPSPTPTIDPAVAEATTAVVEAYRGYWAAKVASFADPTAQQDPGLARFSDDTALTDAQATIASLRSNGIAIPGSPLLEPVVSDVQLGDAPTATITDCVDVTNWQPVVAATGDPAADPNQPLRVPTDSTAFFIDGHWSIRTSVAHRDTTC